jgi:hypothetical protein
VVAVVLLQVDALSPEPDDGDGQLGVFGLADDEVRGGERVVDDVVVLVEINDGLEAFQDDLGHDVLVEGSRSEGELRSDQVHDVSDDHTSCR